MKIGTYDGLDLILKEIGTRTQNYRIKKNMTQKDLAVKSGVSLRTVSAIERGKNTSTENLIRILKTLELDNSINSIIPDSTEEVIIKQAKAKKRYKAPKSVAVWKWGD